jgi:ABC-type spermidine/putrescine transport system permease subunit II
MLRDGEALQEASQGNADTTAAPLNHRRWVERVGECMEIALALLTLATVHGRNAASAASRYDLADRRRAGAKGQVLFAIVIPRQT